MEELYDIFVKSNGVSIDTRTLGKGQLFFALKGERFDANEFIDEALTKDPIAIVAEVNHHDPRVILVDCSLKTLQDLAKYHRSQLSIPFIGITGSNGKTTTKELLHSVLNEKYKCYATKGNFNNHIGVPLTLLSIDASHEIAIIEMGANHIGEIEALCAIARPTHGLITNIGAAHLEGFGSLEGVIRAKNELYQSLSCSDGVIFYNEYSDLLKSLLPQNTSNVSYGSKVEVIQSTPSLEVSIDGQSCKTQLVGKYNVTNIACADKIGSYFGVNTENIQRALESYTPTNNRSQLITVGNRHFIVDCYNANPMSMLASIDNVMSIEAPFYTLILGHMLELGKFSQEEHQNIIDKLEGLDSVEVFLVGKEWEATTHSFNYYLDIGDLIGARPVDTIPEGYILMKGSRGARIEKYLEHLS